MKRAVEKLQRFVIGSLAILSLCVSSVAACACDHHDSEPQPERSCHGTTPSAHHEKPSATPGPSISENCNCVPIATKLSVKTEGFKLKKHTAETAFDSKLESPTFYSSVPSVNDESAVAILVDSRSQSPPARGPPVS